MSGSKKLVNQTGVYMNYTLNVRKGSEVGHHLKNVDGSLDPGASKNVQYGDDQNPFLDGVSYEYKPAGKDLVSFSAQVAVRGSQWDNVFNTHNTLTFHDISPAASISGSET